nr:MAG TPA: protein of unknown function (DUF5601) [Caudoviricetes sp.]
MSQDWYFSLEREVIMKGFWSGLTEEQKSAILEYRGPENHGDPAFYTEFTKAVIARYPKVMAELARDD